MARTRKVLFALLSALLILLLAVAILSGGMTYAEAAESVNAVYWSKTHAPILYGAEEISIPVGTAFDPLDPRFRTFATDFEDGDITPVVTFDDVQTDEEGEHSVKYKATDSHGNVSELTVLVHVVAAQEVIVKRKLYAIASNWSTANAGFSRCDMGDRQIIGIYMPAGSKLNIRLLSDNLSATTGSANLGLNLLNNDQNTEKGVNITYSSAGAFTEVINTTNVGCVPLLTSPILKRGQDILTTFEAEVKYGNDVKPLDFYKSGDSQYSGHSEDDFKSHWGESQAYAAYIEGETASFVLPYRDYGWIKDPSTDKRIYFTTFESLFAYYDKVIYRFNELVGLSFNPEKATDQCVRAKYLVKANLHGAGLAYYSGNHIGFNSDSIWGYFAVGWATLHEIAHGYQGYLGKSTMGLGEVSNNIIGHYVQLDRSIYPNEDDWLGKPNDRATITDSEGNKQNVTKEYARNYARLNGKTFNEQEVGDKLYFIINLFDAVDGDMTYAAMFSYYRERIENKTFTSATPNQDVYALFFADMYGINVLPYFNAWKLDVSTDVAEYVSKAPDALCVLADCAGDALESIVDGEGIDAIYAPVYEDVMEEYGVKSAFTVRAEIDEAELLNGKQVLLQKNGKIVAQAPFVDGVATFEDVQTASYNLRLPVVTDYNISSPYVTLCVGENEYAAEYEKAGKQEHYAKLVVLGIHGTMGYELTLSDNNLKGTVKMGGADLGNKDFDREQLYVSVTIKDENGEIIDEQSVNGGGGTQAYFNYQAKPFELRLEYGYTVEVHAERPQYVHVQSLLTGKNMAAYDTQLKDFAYRITEKGFEATYIENFSVDDALYDETRADAQKKLEEARDYFAAHPEALEERYLARDRKNAAADAYARLKQEDRTDFDALMSVINKGGSPRLEATKYRIEIEEAGGEIDWYGAVTAYDAEDGNITLDERNCKVECNYDGVHAGEYDAKITVVDSDGNASAITIKLSVLKNKPKEINGLAIGLIAGICVAIAIALVLTIVLSVKTKRKYAGGKNKI